MASAAANQGQGTAEDIQAESQLWSIIKMGFLGSHKLPLGPVSYKLSYWSTCFQAGFYAVGEAAEMYWVSNAYHRGGYPYRLCQVPDGQYWKVTEECFQQGHLNFSGRKYSLFKEGVGVYIQTLIGISCLSLVLYGIRIGWLPCTERIYYRL